MTGLRAGKHPPLPRRERDEQSEDDQGGDRPIDDRPSLGLVNPLDVPQAQEQADDPDEPEESRNHEAEGSGPRAKRHQPVREAKRHQAVKKAGGRAPRPGEQDGVEPL